MNVNLLMLRFALGLAAQILVLGWVMDWDNEFETIIAIELVFTAMAFLPLVKWLRNYISQDVVVTGAAAVRTKIR